MGDVDISLRSIASSMPEDLSAALFPGARVEIKGWRESQLTQLERRLDDLLELVIDDAPLLQHFEWQLAWEADIPERVYAYQSMVVLAQLQQLAVRRAEAAARRAAGEEVDEPPGAIVPVESAVVLLSGRKKEWEPELSFRTSRPTSAFNGVHFRVVAVYQRTVEELLALPGRLWLVFAPIAKDASVETVQRGDGGRRESTHPGRARRPVGNHVPCGRIQGCDRRDPGDVDESDGRPGRNLHQPALPPRAR